jgi:hypothetical protein
MSKRTICDVFIMDEGKKRFIAQGLKDFKTAKDYVRDNCAVDYCDYYIQPVYAGSIYKSKTNGKWQKVRSVFNY